MDSREIVEAMPVGSYAWVFVVREPVVDVPTPSHVVLIRRDHKTYAHLLQATYGYNEMIFSKGNALSLSGIKYIRQDLVVLPASEDEVAAVEAVWAINPDLLEALIPPMPVTGGHT